MSNVSLSDMKAMKSALEMRQRASGTDGQSGDLLSAIMGWQAAQNRSAESRDALRSMRRKALEERLAMEMEIYVGRMRMKERNERITLQGRAQREEQSATRPLPTILGTPAFSLS